MDERPSLQGGPAKQKERPPWKPGQALPSFSRPKSRWDSRGNPALDARRSECPVCFRMAPVVAWLPEPTLTWTDSKRSTRGCNQLFCFSVRCRLGSDPLLARLSASPHCTRIPPPQICVLPFGGKRPLCPVSRSRDPHRSST